MLISITFHLCSSSLALLLLLLTAAAIASSSGKATLGRAQVSVMIAYASISSHVSGKIRQSFHHCDQLALPSAADGAEPYVDGQVALLARTPQCKLDYTVS